jgi:endonuclease V-like protein UPF0215 family
LLKKEIRLLGLSVAKKNLGLIVVGVVFRGNRWLDGVISSLTEPNDHDYISSISRTIRHSKQYSQLHAVILAKQELFSSHELAQLASRISTPVIAVLKPSSDARNRINERPNLGSYELRVSGKHVSVLAAGVSKDEVERIFAIGCNPSASVPEAVRVAELILKQAKPCQLGRTCFKTDENLAE